MNSAGAEKFFYGSISKLYVGSYFLSVPVQVL